MIETKKRSTSFFCSNMSEVSDDPKDLAALTPNHLQKMDNF